MPFRRYVSIGRVAYVNLAEDPLYGKLVVIVDIVDQNRVRPPRWLRGWPPAPPWTTTASS
jgi:hypothetical protein